MWRRHSRIHSAALAAALFVTACSDPVADEATGLPPTSIVAVPETSGSDGIQPETVTTDPAAADDAGGSAVEAVGQESPDTASARFASGNSSFLFDPDVVHTFDIDLEPELLDEIDDDPGAEEYVEGSLTFGGETLDRIGIRYKGSVGAFLGCTTGSNPLVPSGPKSCTKLSLKLKINWDGADVEFYGQRRIQLHSMNLDRSMLRDRLGYHLFNEAGVDAPRASHARVNVNGEYVGLFALIEQIDGRFVRDRFVDGTGNLYKEVWPFDSDGTVRSQDDLVEALKTNEDEDPSVHVLQSFAQEILDAGAATDPDAARRVLGERTDLEALVSYAVVDRAIRNDDGPFHWYCLRGPCEPHNFYLYEDPSAGTVHVIPWDLDNAMNPSNPITTIADEWGETSNDCEPFPFGPINLLQRSAACDPFVAAWALLDEEYAAADAAFRSGPFAPENVRPLLDTWASQIEPHVIEAAELHDDAPSVEEWRAAIDQLSNDLVAPAEQEN